MKITAWSPGRKSGGVTANIVALSTFLSSRYDVSIGLRSNHFCERMMEDYFSVTSTIKPIAGGNSFFSGWGSPDYIKYLLDYKDKYERRSYRGHMAVGCRGKISLYAPQEPYEDKPFPNTDDELFIVDASGENSYAAFEAMDHADLRMIFLPGDIGEAIHQFRPYKAYAGRALFLFNRRNTREKPTVSDFCQEFKIKRSRVFSLPYCADLERACLRGEVDLMALYHLWPTDSEYFQKADLIAKKLISLNENVNNIF